MKINQKTKQKKESREAITASAAALLRERGIKSSSVTDVMKGAGLTVGGFYNHFDSKEELFVETLHKAVNANCDQLLKSAKGESPRTRTLSVIKEYLSQQHRDKRETGCPLPSAVAEVARAGEPYRSGLERELSGFVSSFADMQGGGADAREKSLGLFALMYGALSLSRAVAGTRLSDEFLHAGRKLAQQALAER